MVSDMRVTYYVASYSSKEQKHWDICYQRVFDSYRLYCDRQIEKESKGGGRTDFSKGFGKVMNVFHSMHRNYIEGSTVASHMFLDKMEKPSRIVYSQVTVLLNSSHFVEYLQNGTIDCRSRGRNVKSGSKIVF